ncbi:MAG TPA: DUF2203 domain-containing protein [Roseiflexaceae bacterium]|nr:DUF2203 domain-containing protein [Roseiflexaceae bacterium]
MTRYFTIDEANALLPVLRPQVAALVRAWRRLSASHAAVIAILNRAPRSDLGGPPLSDAAADIIRVQNALFAIQSHGVELKDPATGLLDFPALRDGVAVYLCWRYGEPRVAYWHPIETGFAGRRPIDDL